MKKIVYLLFIVTSLAYSQDIKWDPATTFDAVFDIDAVHTKDGVNYELSASGDAGPYGKRICPMYLQITITVLLVENLRVLHGHRWEKKL